MVDPAIERFVRNQPYARVGPYTTALKPDQESQFEAWVKSNGVPFDPGPYSDYDMRGYWLNNAADRPVRNKNDGLPHYPDTYKTPFHQSFSVESVYSKPNAPVWQEDRLVDPKTGSVLYDEALANGR